jgi:hypothetical protein
MQRWTARHHTVQELFPLAELELVGGNVKAVVELNGDRCDIESQPLLCLARLEQVV